MGAASPPWSVLSIFDDLGILLVGETIDFRYCPGEKPWFKFTINK
jgi:hypothetical protein